jgi:hypothetical protein
MSDLVTNLSPWEVVKYDWGVAVRHRKGRWTNIVFYDGQELDLETLGMDVILHENGIEFVKGR